MRLARLSRLIVGDLRRNLRHFMLASIGIIVGIAAFSFFIALGQGVRAVVLGDIFPLDKLEVVPKSLEFDLGPVRMGMGADALDDAAVETMREIPNVVEVYPKMKLTVASTAHGGKEIFGNNLRSEILGDGIDPRLVKDEIARGYEFKDFEAEFESDPTTLVHCQADADCNDEHLYCQIDPPPKKRRDRNGKKTQDPDDPPPAGVCRHYIPVVVNPHMIEMYNGVLRRAHGFPKLNPDFVVGFRWQMNFGASMVRASVRDEVVRRKAELVGFSDKAISIGATMPIGYVKRLNVKYGTEESGSEYHSVIVEVDSKENVAAVAHVVEEELDYAIQDTGAKQAALLIAVFMMVFGTVSVIIVGIAAINIMHVFFMLIYERQRELGIMRAVGATRSDIRTIILGQAALVGLVAGSVGVMAAMLFTRLFDMVSNGYVPDFPYKPETYFEFGPLLVLGALGFAVGFCVLGAALPARRAARLDPAAVLTGR